ncbi:U11/U12 small nuclear ribonucleoprotein 31 kDa protein [Morus notabilis]|nr:U11/U12 small nuclear ribonucleoprotein 31 kDa protein [Morus notabilis]XP_024025954.1 U11/U12 small nuclear ribonucleoprotein 31 kDa protein [Morus notabilis]XP_024025955.1 U11/U12 small nuclear ribonucleoprotein 31 kDa protein [Morus notabilis]XP_024025956.1 U11/U12 small nuclear ribonucleoprotein 31 kDa protein [Morus notabilis]
MVKNKKTTKKNNPTDSDDDDDTFYYRYASAAANPPDGAGATTSAAKKHSGGGGGSGTLAPSKSTLYVSNIDFALTNSDLHTLFSTFGKIARVSVLKDRHTRQSRGVAFVQFVSRDDAVFAASQMHGKVLNGRTLTASIAADNGRSAEFIRKRVYRDKSRCYECGAEGHLSYECPKNQLGPRERPPPKRERGRGGGGGGGGGRGTNCWRENEQDEEIGPDGGEGFEEDNWASVVDGGADDRLLRSRGDGGQEKKRMKKASYFSDESGDDEDD